MDDPQLDQRTHLKFDQDFYLPIWIDGFLKDRKAANMTTGTLRFYQQKLANFQAYCESLAITQIDQLTPTNLRDYLIHLENTGHTSGGVHSFYRAVKAFINWWENEVEPENWRNPFRKVKAPKVETAVLEPADQDDIDAMLDTCSSRGFTDLRDKAIILILMDTGLRASELLSVELVDLDPVKGDILIREGKGRKPRLVMIGKRTRKAVRAYLRVRSDSSPMLIVSEEGEPITYQGLRMVIRRRAHQAGIKKPPSLHSFRRYFAISYLRNGGDIYTLEKLMGHADLQILKRYLKLLDDDIRAAHRQYSPVDNM